MPRGSALDSIGGLSWHRTLSVSYAFLCLPDSVFSDPLRGTTKANAPDRGTRKALRCSTVRTRHREIVRSADRVGGVRLASPRLSSSSLGDRSRSYPRAPGRSHSHRALSMRPLRSVVGGPGLLHRSNRRLLLRWNSHPRARPTASAITLATSSREIEW